MSYSEIDYLRDELDDYKRRERERQDQEYERHEQRRREAKQRYQDSLLEADTWPEALEKNCTRFLKEVREQQAFLEQYPDSAPDPTFDDWFQESYDASAKALELWPEVTRRYQTQIDALRKQIADLEAQIPLEVAKQLREINNEGGWRATANELENSTPGQAVYW